MSLFQPAGALFAAAVLMSQAAIAEPVFSFKSARIDPPDRGVTFAGPGSDALKIELPRVSLGRHGHEPAAPSCRDLESGGREDDPHLQGAGRREGRAGDRRLSC